MTIKTTIEIFADESGSFTAREQAVLAALAGTAPAKAPEVKTNPASAAPAEEPKAAPAKPAARKPTAKAPAKPSPTRAAVLEDTPDFEPVTDSVEENQKDLEASESDSMSVEDVINAARKLVGSHGKQLKVAATAAGLAKISDMKTAEQAQAFIGSMADQGVKL